MGLRGFREASLPESWYAPNSTLERTAGSHSLAAAAEP